jgi:hypothetical protein
MMWRSLVQVSKPSKSHPRQLADVLRKTVGEVFAKRGFAATELVTRWTEIVGAEIATHSEPERIQWRRPSEGQAGAPGTLILRVEGPTAVEIQHLSGIIMERVNRFFGWQAVGGLRLRQAPLGRRQSSSATPAPDPEATARVAAELSQIADEKLRDALARLGASVKHS